MNTGCSSNGLIKTSVTETITGTMSATVTHAVRLSDIDTYANENRKKQAMLNGELLYGNETRDTKVKTIYTIIMAIVDWLIIICVIVASSLFAIKMVHAEVPDETDCDTASIIVETYYNENTKMEYDGMIRKQDITEYCTNQIIIEQFNKYREEYCGIPTSGEGR